MTYEEAKKLAQKKADEGKNYDYGIEKNAFGYSVFMLPSPSKRFGYERRCEVVRPTAPGPHYKGFEDESL